MNRLKQTAQFAIAALLAGCSAPSAGSSSPITRTILPYAVAPLDAASVSFRDGTRVELPVSQEGRIDLPTGQEFVRGLPARQLHTLVARAYPDAREIRIREFRTNRVTVLGEVYHQIHTDLSDGPMRVMDAIASANGFTPLANKRRVRLVRQNAGLVEVYELDLREMMLGTHLDQNLLLEPGDVITVPRNFL